MAFKFSPYTWRKQILAADTPALTNFRQIFNMCTQLRCMLHIYMHKGLVHTLTLNTCGIKHNHLVSNGFWSHFQGNTLRCRLYEERRMDSSILLRIGTWSLFGRGTDGEAYSATGWQRWNVLWMTTKPGIECVVRNITRRFRASCVCCWKRSQKRRWKLQRRVRRRRNNIRETSYEIGNVGRLRWGMSHFWNLTHWRPNRCRDRYPGIVNDCVVMSYRCSHYLCWVGDLY